LALGFVVAITAIILGVTVFISATVAVIAKLLEFFTVVVAVCVFIQLL
jgi:hypothetical protein